MKKAILTSLISACFIFPTVYLTACNKNNDVTVETKSTVVQGKTMGTFYQVNVVGGYKGGEDGLKALAEGAFAKITKAISTFDKDAELYKFNDFKSTEPFKISDDLSVMIQNTVYQGRRIEGATDIRVGPLVNLWGFGKDKKDGNKPSQEQIEETLKLVGQDKFELLLKEDGAYLVKHDPNVRLDLATVGEGLGADFVAELLIKEGYQNFMVNVAGASRSYGKNAKGKVWKLGIEDPTSKQRKVYTAICALDKAVTTAGSYRNYFKDETSGKIYSHAIDPKTGYPVAHQTMSVTVISDSAFESDALDTGLLVLGADKALAWGEKNQYAIATIEYKDGKTVFRYTDKFKPYLDCAKR